MKQTNKLTFVDFQGVEWTQRLPLDVCVTWTRVVNDCWRSRTRRRWSVTFPVRRWLPAPLPLLSDDPPSPNPPFFWLTITPLPCAMPPARHPPPSPLTPTPLSMWWKLRQPHLFACCILPPSPPIIVSEAVGVEQRNSDNYEDQIYVRNNNCEPPTETDFTMYTSWLLNSFLQWTVFIDTETSSNICCYDQQTMGSICARTIDVTHWTASTQQQSSKTWVAYDNSTSGMR